MALAKNTVTDKSSSSLFSYDFTRPSNDFACPTMNLIDIDLDKIFVSSSTNDNQNNNNNNQLFNERFLNDFIDHNDEQVKPPPGFEHFHQPMNNNNNNSPSDTMNLSQLLSPTIVADAEQPLRGTVRSSSSSTTTSDDQSQRTNYSYSIPTISQIYSPKIPSQTSTSKHSLKHSSSLSSTNSNNSTSRIPNYFSTDNRISSSSSSSPVDDTTNTKLSFPSTKTSIEFNPEQQAMQDNLNFLASMTNESNFIPNPIQIYIDNLNELCYQGFDHLNALIQEQRWVENFLNLPPTSKKLSLSNHSSSSEVLIICEYFIFKCKKYQPIASQIFEYLANDKVELRLKELIFVFQSWKQAIHHAEQIHREEEKKFLLVYHHPQTYHLNKNILQLAFNRLYNAIRQLINLTEKTRATYQQATLNVFQIYSRQIPIQSAQFLSMQQDHLSFS